jgi:hypothetical protein
LKIRKYNSKKGGLSGYARLSINIDNMHIKKASAPKRPRVMKL